MPKTRQQKERVVAALAQDIKSSEFGVLTDFKGLSMLDLDKFRNRAREKGIKYTVVKAALLDIAAKKAGLKGIVAAKSGKSYGLALGGQDEVTISKLVHQFSKETEGRVNIAVGIINSEVVPAETIKHLALVPSYEELLARVVGSMNAPISNFVYGLNYNLQSFYNVIKAIQSARS